MPAISDFLWRRAGDALRHVESTVAVAERELVQSSESPEFSASVLVARVNLKSNVTSPPGLIEANTRDPWNKSGKYALGWVYFCIILLVFASLLRFYNLFTDRIRTALHQEEVQKSSKTSSPSTDYEMLDMPYTDKSTNKLFPRTAFADAEKPQEQSSLSSIGPVNNVVAVFRYLFYRQLPEFQLRKRGLAVTFPSMGVTVITICGLVFVALYCFIPQPYYWESMEYGSPPLAIRAGMLAVAMMPWIIAMSMKANFVSLLTGIGPERLNVLHRYGAYLCLFLSLVHMIPFYIAPMHDQRGYDIYKTYFDTQGLYIYGTGIAAFVPLAFLCIHSIRWLRTAAYELFVTMHVPISIVYVGMLFWHCRNYLTSWNYLIATVVIWATSYIFRLFYLNWANPKRLSWLIGDEASVTLLPENAIKVTIPTQMKWRPGQYVYLRMPGISVFENHPFTIASLCSEDFPSDYGDEYRDMVLVFRPFGGFTKRVLKSAIERGPYHSYRAFIDGPYGGMRRRLEAFDNVVLIAGGSGITAIASQLLDLIKRMRDGKAVTKSVQVIWALKRPETMEWFKEELRICREFAPPDTVHCEFFITAAKRQPKTGAVVSAQTPNRPVSTFFKDRVNDAFQDIADKRLSNISTKRHSALIRDEAAGDPEREKELRRENEDAISALPQAHVKSPVPDIQDDDSFLSPTRGPSPRHNIDKRRNLALDISAAVSAGHGALDPSLTTPTTQQAFDFGFPSTPTEFQKNLMRFAFLPAAVKKRDGWSTEYGRPDIPYMLRQSSREWGRRTCVFVCGPPGMRISVSDTVADLQKLVLRRDGVDEVFLHAENYAI
ncbi:hypothetical protein K402DRAFT_346269 [Aulographum hederae CBS 113979]|uniref:ferric-chelate reductase (NADPH) n=1 Tax=Aulographum hederae CBS 113979 TaxID=1176131 RepID=A0A6G1HE83_9PEZI|nr:hypothetical protein K402DRAFT_346269 [Aulographum hederae CBS 113979]